MTKNICIEKDKVKTFMHALLRENYNYVTMEYLTTEDFFEIVQKIKTTDPIKQETYEDDTDKDEDDTDIDDNDNEDDTDEDDTDEDEDDTDEDDKKQQYEDMIMCHGVVPFFVRRFKELCKETYCYDDDEPKFSTNEFYETLLIAKGRYACSFDDVSILRDFLCNDFALEKKYYDKTFVSNIVTKITFYIIKCRYYRHYECLMLWERDHILSFTGEITFCRCPSDLSWYKHKYVSDTETDSLWMNWNNGLIEEHGFQICKQKGINKAFDLDIVSKLTIDPKMFISRAVKYGDFEAIKYGFERGWDVFACNCDVDQLFMKAARNSWRCLQFLHENLNKWNVEIIYYHKVCREAAESGNLDCLLYALDHGYEPDWSDDDSYHSILSKVIENGDFEMCKLMHASGYKFNSKDICWYAARHGQLDILQYVIENGCPWHEFTCSNAAKNGDLEMLQYAHENGCPWNSCVCSSAALNGHLDILLYARQNNCPWDEHTCSNAAANRDLEMLQYAHENGCPWDEKVCSIAAENRDLEMLQYAHENGCPWDEHTCSNAAKNGDLEMLQYAHENGCPWNEKVCSIAAKNCDFKMLQYAHENGCPWNKEVCSNAAYNGHLKILQYAHENGCPWDDEICCRATYNGHLEILQYAHENGCPWNYEVYHAAIMGGHLNCFRYAFTNNCPIEGYDINDIMNDALMHNCMDFIKYLCQNAPYSFATFLEEAADVWHLHRATIDLEDEWWRQTLFPLDLKKYRYLNNLHKLVTRKKKQMAQSECKEALSNYITKDVLERCLLPYI